MILLRTVKIFLTNAKEQLLPTAIAYTNAYNYACQDGYDGKITSGYDLHKRTYQHMRETLPSQLAVSARTKAIESLVSIAGLKRKGKKTSCPKSKLCSIRYDARSYSLWLERNEVSLLTLEGRKRFAFSLPECYSQYRTWKNKSAELKIYGKQVILNVVFEKEITDTEPNGNIIGCDRGENNLAVLSNGKFFGGRKIKQKARQYRKLRTELQKKGTRSAKRHLRKIRSKERRFRADVNHCISKQIVALLQTGDTVVLEKLTDIRKNMKRKKKHMADAHSWSFYQLEQFLIYKAMAKGINVVFIDGRYTSQSCSKCGNIRKANRKGSRFNCRECGYTCDADLNASFNIAQKYQAGLRPAGSGSVNSPNGSNSNVSSTATLADTSPCL